MRLFLIAAALLAASPALAQREPEAPDPRASRATIIVEPVAMMIAAFDTDGDARVTRDEFDAGVRHSFESIDTAQKDYLSYIGFADWAERWLGSRGGVPDPFEVDTDADNKVTLAELQARFALLFTRFDADKDGVLVRSELLSNLMQREMDRRRQRQRGQ